MSRYRDDDDSERPPPSTAPDRRSRPSISHSDASELIDRKATALWGRQQEKISQYIADREQASERRMRRDRETTEKLSLIEQRISDLYTRDADDVLSSKRLEQSLEEALRQFKEFKTDLLLQMKTLNTERDTMTGRVQGIKWTVLGVGGFITFIAPFILWLLGHIHW